MTKTKTYTFLSGDGEMAKLTREKDWSKTSLGTPDTWPQSLRTTLNIVLNSRFPKFLWWGPELVCFYNDAYRPSLGKDGKHPSILGMPAKEAWPEIWDIIKPLIDQVLETGKATWSEDQLVPIYRNGKIEDVYWTFSYCPVNNDEGIPDGILVTCTETTEKVRAHARLEASKNELDQTLHSAGVGTWSLDLDTNVVTSNQLIKEWYGIDKDEIHLEEILECIDPRDIPHVQEAIEEAIKPESTGEHEVRYRLHNKITGQVRTIHAKGKLTYREGENPKLSGVALDITKETSIVAELEEGRKELNFTLNAAQIATWNLNPKTNHFIGNDLLKEWFGIDLNDEIPLETALERIVKKDRDRVVNEIQKTLSPGSPGDYEIEYSIINPETEEKRRVKAKGKAIFDENDQPIRFSGILQDITSQYLAKKRIEESERRFRTVADSAPVMIWMTDTNKQTNFFNKAWLKFTGNKLKDDLGSSWTDSIHPKDYERCNKIYDRAFGEKKGFYMEHRLRRHDDEYRWVFIKGEPRFSTEGQFDGYIGACMDIHERVIIQKRIKENEQKLNLIIEASELGVWEHDIPNQTAMCSEKCLDILGLDEKEEIEFKRFFKNFHPKDIDKSQKSYSRSFENGSLHLETRLLVDDRTLWIEAKGNVYYDIDGRPARLIGTVRDITRERFFQQQLQEREQKFRLLADSMPQQVWTAEPDGNITYFNQSVYDYSGLSKDQLFNGGWIQIVHPEDRKENIREWTKSIATGNDFLFEHRFRKHDGEYRWQLSRAIPQRDTHGNIKMWVGTSTDIQDQKTFTQKLEKQVAERTKELRQKNIDLENMNTELQSFAYISSHDLQEPLRKIQTFSSQIMEKEIDNLTDRGKDRFDRMQRAARRMQTLIEDLLAYSRTNITDRKFEQVKLQEIVDEVKEDLKEELEVKNAKVEVSVDQNVNIITFQFKQLLYNLISNSLKFARDGVDPVISIKAEEALGSELAHEDLKDQEMYCHIAISDNGIGFEDQYKDRIFQVFQRLHGRTKYSGTGIGLAIVKKIVDNHEGFISAAGKSGEGATFDIFIPSQSNS
ncbi:PAS domain S-box protein [Fulvivirga sp. RKSG066]|uniref:PAS domain-containing sensor histidine kinase n=1 Tax=Fulvivirga aurantia TaxID=2529383 RepID=UPI0012BBFBA0|nr:PAS domain S-box protein [Fulvivirga aurantia]MTI22365.1 PAS domain S-box protein [Fulvivirga aurantia]